jgi:hypothetical protein
MALDERYVTGFSLEEYFVDKDSGTPLAAGTIEFWEDSNRTTPKNVYTLSGSPPNYTYSVLPNPVVLSGVGTIEDNSGNNVALYCYPYDGLDNAELYYVVVKDAAGVVQFTREAWPNITDATNIQNQNTVTNELDNPQFVEVLFDPSASVTLAIATSATTVQIAPGWFLEATASSPSTIVVGRTSIAGSQGLPTNPPYTINFTMGANISAATIYQRLNNNPDIWSALSGDTYGYLATAIVLSEDTDVTIKYVPSTGTSQTLLTASNATGVPVAYRNTVQLEVGDNTETSDSGYVDIVIELDASKTAQQGFTSVQVVGVDSDQDDIFYNQETVSRQKSLLSSYYKPQLAYKQVPSHLIGWDFPFNPSQFGETIPVAAIGANKSQYVWDQTIAFQTIDSGVSFARAASGALEVTGKQTGQIALVQYLPQANARSLLGQRISVHIAGLTSIVGGISGKVTIWYTDDAALPDVSDGTNESLVLTIDSTGKPVTTTGNWSEVPRGGLGDATFKIEESSTTQFNDIDLSGWDLEGAAAVNTTTFVAIVVGFESFLEDDTIDIHSISLCSGDIATRPAPIPEDDVLRNCRYYYETSYVSDVTPGTVTDVGMITEPLRYTDPLDGGGITRTIAAYASGFSLEFTTQMRSSSPVITVYSTATGDANKAYGVIELELAGNPDDTITAELNVSDEWNQVGLSARRVTFEAATVDPVISKITLQSLVGAPYISFHYVVDARLGIV